MRLKNRRLTLSLVIIVAALTLSVIINAAYSRFANSTNDGKKVILIDPGHGGIDGGAVSKRGTMEKNINLAISLKLKEKLQNQGFKVIMTREDDRGLYSEGESVRNQKYEDLNNRARMKIETKCDMFISIHLNIFPQSQYYGAQVWYSNREDSKNIAHLIQENLKNDIKNGNTRIEKPAKGMYKILRSYDEMPSVIVECGFISNPQEEDKLKDSSYHDQLAESIAKSINMYFQQSINSH